MDGWDHCGQLLCCCLKDQSKAVGGTSICHDNKILFVQTQNVAVLDSLVRFSVLVSLLMLADVLLKLLTGVINHCEHAST